VVNVGFQFGKASGAALIMHKKFSHELPNTEIQTIVDFIKSRKAESFSGELKYLFGRGVQNLVVVTAYYTCSAFFSVFKGLTTKEGTVYLGLQDKGVGISTEFKVKSTWLQQGEYSNSLIGNLEDNKIYVPLIKLQSLKGKAKYSSALRGGNKNIEEEDTLVDWSPTWNELDPWGNEKDDNDDR
jgi:hypothetical protein